MTGLYSHLIDPETRGNVRDNALLYRRAGQVGRASVLVANAIDALNAGMPDYAMRELAKARDVLEDNAQPALVPAQPTDRQRSFEQGV